MAKKQKKMTVAAKDAAVIAVVMLIAGWLLGNIYATSFSGNTQEVEPMEMTSMDDHAHDEMMVHSHGEGFALDPSVDAIPEVTLLADRDAKGGWNLTLVTSNFEFTPERISEADVAGQGHAHLWVDGEKITRLYGNYYYLDSLGEGDHEIAVTLNANSHKDFVVNGEVIGDSVTVTEISQ